MTKRLQLLLLLLYSFCNCLHSQSIDSTKWTHGISIGPTYEFRDVQLNSGSTTNKQDSYELGCQIPKTGILIKYTFEIRIPKSRFFVSTGIAYEDKGFSSNASDSIFNYSPNKIPPYTGGTKMLESWIYKKEYRYHSISVPIALTYRYKLGKLFFMGSIGIAYEAPCITTQVTHFTSPNSYYTIPDDVNRNDHNWNVDLLVNLGVGITIQKKIILSFAPGFTQCLLYKDVCFTDYYSCRMYSFTFPVSLTFCY